MIDVEPMENKLTKVEVKFEAEVDYNFLEEFKKIVDHHMEYLLDLEAFPEIKSISKATLYKTYNGYISGVVTDTDLDFNPFIYFNQNGEWVYQESQGDNYKKIFDESIDEVRFSCYNCINPKTDLSSVFVISFTRKDNPYIKNEGIPFFIKANNIVFKRINQNFTIDEEDFYKKISKAGLKIKDHKRVLSKEIMKIIRDNISITNIPYEYGWQHPQNNNKNKSIEDINRETYWWGKDLPVFEYFEKLLEEEK